MLGAPEKVAYNFKTLNVGNKYEDTKDRLKNNYTDQDMYYQ